MDTVFESVSYEGRVGSICSDLGLSKPLLAQSMYIFKQARIGDIILDTLTFHHQTELLDGTLLKHTRRPCLSPPRWCLSVHGATVVRGVLVAVGRLLTAQRLSVRSAALAPAHRTKTLPMQRPSERGNRLTFFHCCCCCLFDD